MQVLRILRLLIAIPLVLVLVSFVLSNRTSVSISLWPIGTVDGLHLWMPILGAMAIAFLAGAFVVWVGELGRRRRARQAEQTIKLLEDQVRALKAQLSPPPHTG